MCDIWGPRGPKTSHSSSLLPTLVPTMKRESWFRVVARATTSDQVSAARGASRHHLNSVSAAPWWLAPPPQLGFSRSWWLAPPPQLSLGRPVVARATTSTQSRLPCGGSAGGGGASHQREGRLYREGWSGGFMARAIIAKDGRRGFMARAIIAKDGRRGSMARAPFSGEEGGCGRRNGRMGGQLVAGFGPTLASSSIRKHDARWRPPSSL